VHFVVVGNSTNKGIEYGEAMDSLKVEFDRLAGGYTEIGATSGGFMPANGKIESEQNTSFMVSSHII